jgi:hypothetical protein
MAEEAAKCSGIVRCDPVDGEVVVHGRLVVMVVDVVIVVVNSLVVQIVVH